MMIPFRNRSRSAFASALILVTALGFTVWTFGLTASLPGGPTSAHAACPSAPRSASSISSQFDGAWNTGFSFDVGGIYAQIQKQPPYVASGSRVSHWVMLYKNSTSQWSQIGFYYDNTYGTRIFAQLQNQPGLTTKFGSAASSGSYPYFTVLYNNPTGKFSFQLNSINWIPDGESQPYQPTAIWGPRDTAEMAERHNNADQVPGGYNSHTGHYDTHLWYSGSWNDGWMTTDNWGISFHGVDPSSGNLAYYNGKQFYIWDTQCAT